MPVRARLRVMLTLGVATFTVAVLLGSSPAGAEDPLARAQARISAAQAASDRAAADFDAAQTSYYESQQDAVRTRAEIARLTASHARLASVVRARAVLTYVNSSQSSVFDLFDLESADIMNSARRVVLADRVNARDASTIRQLIATTQDLHARERALEQTLARERKGLADVRHRQDELQRDLADATRAANELRAELDRQRRAGEYLTLVRQAVDAARAHDAQLASRKPPSSGDNGGGGDNSGGGRGGGGGGGGDQGGGGGGGSGSGWVCPVQGGVSFSDTYGSPRSGGRSHKGTDMFAARGTPVVAVLAGSVLFQGDPLGGNSAYVQGSDGNTYYYAHLDDYVGGARSVAAGEVIGHVGTTGNASDAPPHLHFEIRIGGPNGTQINPYPTLAAHC